MLHVQHSPHQKPVQRVSPFLWPTLQNGKLLFSGNLLISGLETLFPSEQKWATRADGHTHTLAYHFECLNTYSRVCAVLLHHSSDRCEREQSRRSLGPMQRHIPNVADSSELNAAAVYRSTHINYGIRFSYTFMPILCARKWYLVGEMLLFEWNAEKMVNASIGPMVRRWGNEGGIEKSTIILCFAVISVFWLGKFAQFNRN